MDTKGGGVAELLERFGKWLNKTKAVGPDLKYAGYIILHKLYVYQAGRKLGLGRVQLLLHDLHKLTPTEWKPYTDTFYRNLGSLARDAFDRAWLHHKKTMGKHHWQYWILMADNGTWKPLEMPEKYRLEMLADWMGAGKAITGKMDVQEWYRANRDRMILHPNTRRLVERVLFYGDG